MAACVVTIQLEEIDGGIDATDVYTFYYRQSGLGQSTSTTGVYISGWTPVTIGGSASAQTFGLEQAEYYDFKFPAGGKLWNNTLCPSASTADINDLLTTAS